MKSIFLCGFMGCGKTTVGRVLAKKTGMKFVDMDRYIEKKKNMTVSEIFSEYGEDYFRDLEHDACTRLSQSENLIVATGGGALTYERNCKVIRDNASVLYLSVPLDIIAKRLENDTKRPLLQRPDKEQAMKELYSKRIPLYKGCATAVADASGSPGAVAELIISTMGLKKHAAKSELNPQNDKLTE